MVAAPVGMTAEQLVGYEIPGKRVELVRGVLVVREPASFRHGDIAARLAVALRQHLVRERDANGWSQSRGRLAIADPGFTLERHPDTVRAPDVAYVSRERFSGPFPDGFPELAPDLAVEVRSPGDRPGELLAKVADFLSAGTRAVWVVVPSHEQVHVYRADGAIAVLGVADHLIDAELLPDFDLPVAELFADD
ncbi:MAG: Uma2 family endonuclease [Gemmatimonadaceae bacterium]|nr:Uma2 family endonuclease [Gemmatimonadaceae bacterium]